MSGKFDVQFSTVEGAPFQTFRVHAVKLPNGSVYDGANGWRSDCPHPCDGSAIEDDDDQAKQEAHPIDNHFIVEAALHEDINGDYYVNITLRSSRYEIENDQTTVRWDETYGTCDFTRDLEKHVISTPVGNVLVWRND